MTILDSCLQGQGHSEGPNLQGIFVPTVASQLLNLSSFSQRFAELVNGVCLECHLFLFLVSAEMIEEARELQKLEVPQVG